MSTSSLMEWLLYVSFAVERISWFKLNDVRDIFSKMLYHDKVLVVEICEDLGNKEIMWRIRHKLNKFRLNRRILL